MLVNYIESQGNACYRYRNAVPLLYLLLGVFIWQWSEPFISQPRHPDAEIIYEICCLAVSLSGLTLRFITKGFGQIPIKSKKDLLPSADILYTKGMYSIVRHPLYLADFFIFLGMVLYIQNFKFITCYFLLFTVFFERIIAAEEIYLKAKFGKQFMDWSDKTPAFFPDISLFKSTGSKFSRKIIFRKGPRFFLKIMVIFYSMEWINYFLVGHKIEFYWHFFMAIGLLLFIMSWSFLKLKTE